MRRIYESDAITRDDEDTFTPNERDTDNKVQSFRSLNAAAWSDRLLPHALRCRAVSVRLSVPRTEFQQGGTVPFRVTMKNSLPMPVTIRTVSPVLWSWSIDGYEEGSHVELRDPPDETGTFRFDRGETLRFERRWSQMFRVSEREWEPAEPGEYRLRAQINVDSEKDRNLGDETTIEIVP